MTLQEEFEKVTNTKLVRIKYELFNNTNLRISTTDHYIEWLESCLLTEREKNRQLSNELNNKEI